jgi:hypothetical protein
MARNFLTSRESGGVLAVAQENSEDSKSSKSQTAHRLMMSPTTFKSLSLAIHNLSMRELELCSPRRLLTSVLEDGDGPLLQLSINELDAVCRAENLTGRVKVNIRIDSSINDRIREFREYAQRRLGRPVSVIEAVNACAYAMNGRV